MSKRIKLFSVALVVFVVVLMAFAGTALASYDFVNHAGDHSMITDASSANRHNVAPVGTNPCDFCHEPHGATAAFLWSRPLSQSQAGSQTADVTNVDAGYSSDIKPLCYSCHDGSVASTGLATAFSNNHFNHRTTAASTVTNGVRRGPGSDCDRCHDPHDDTMRNYLRPEFKTRTYDENGHVVKTNAAGTAILPYSAVLTDPYNTSGQNKTVSRYSPLIKGGDVCASCHESNLPNVTATSGSGRNVHPVYQPAGVLVPWIATMGVGNLTITGTVGPPNTIAALLNGPSATPTIATNPVPGKNPLVSVWPKGGSYVPSGGQYNGTRVFNTDGTVYAGAKNTTAVVACESCHAPHGANDGTATSPDNPTTPFHYLNTMADATLCSNCH